MAELTAGYLGHPFRVWRVVWVIGCSCQIWR